MLVVNSSEEKPKIKNIMIITLISDALTQLASSLLRYQYLGHAIEVGNTAFHVLKDSHFFSTLRQSPNRIVLSRGKSL